MTTGKTIALTRWTFGLMTDQQQQKTATTATNKKQKENHKETGHPKYQVLVSIWSSWNIYALLMVEYIGTTVSE